MIKINDPSYFIPAIFVILFGIGLSFFIASTGYDWLVKQTVEMNNEGYFILFFGVCFSGFVFYYGIVLLGMSEIQILSDVK